MSYLIWVAIAALAAIAELLTGTLFLLVVAIAAIPPAILSFIAPEITPVVPILLFATSMMLGFFVLKRKKPTVSESMRSDVGQRVIVLRPNDDGTFRVRHRGAEWNARIPPPHDKKITLGEVLVIASIDGVTLVCQRTIPEEQHNV